MLIGNLEVYGVIYKITNKINGKCYIGQTIQGFDNRYKYKSDTPIEQVYKYHNNRTNWSKYYNKHLLNSINKYGFEAFEVNKIIDMAFSKEELDIKEQLYIQIYDSYNNGYNKNLGGNSRGVFKHSEETKLKISNGLKGKYVGENSHIYGKPRSEESKQKQSKSRKGKFVGEKAGHYGKEHSEETKQKISKLRKGFKHSEETKLKMSEECKTNPHNYKEVICLETKEIFHSIAEASKIKCCNRTGIGNCLSGISKTCGGYHWMYYEDYLKQYNIKNFEQAV